jgi:hypothetical protein
MDGPTPLVRRVATIEMAGLTDSTWLVFNRRYAAGGNITASDPWVETHGYHHNVATRRT